MIKGKTKILINVTLIVHMVKIRVLILTKKMKTIVTITFMPKVTKPSYTYDTHIMCPMRHHPFWEYIGAIISINLQPHKKKLSWMSIISSNVQSPCNKTPLVTIEQKVKVFREKHTLHMGAYGDLDTNCPIFFSLCEIFGCSPILNDASFFYIKRFWLSEQKKRWEFIMNLAYSWELWGKW